ncbi:hypothetical protein Q31a_40390 [Aureliella helgolandensis]|uniref:Uncharacterized protein n=1 Tax=Aureliella helgolandensis TaxID=2527968 RepID=A0A518GAS7_9BACT|nr:hypothetical protein Q31a_40390 [Aureliella helgolandensis]
MNGKGQPNSSQYMPLAIMFMGIGWCSSAFLSSTGPPVALSFMSPLALGGALACSQTLVGCPAQNIYAEVYSALCAVLGCIAFLTGTIYCLNRVEP